jgi:S-adenosylmethionine synthetase
VTRRHLFTSESVSMGHPDKMADRISDAVLDLMLEADPRARVACEVLLTGDEVIVAGEISSSVHRPRRAEIDALVRETIRDIGYEDAETGFDVDGGRVQVLLESQSADIARGVDGRADGELGAGDQGMMFGYATRQTEKLMPLPITLAHGLVARQAEARRSGDIPGLRPDAKAQVTVAYEDHIPVRVDSVVLSTQHDDRWSDQQDRLAADVAGAILRPVLGRWWSDDITVHVNPTGRFLIGGPRGDTGLTGRKIIVDTYGGWGRHGGGSFSGKDPSKVDRSASYMARYIAKNLVAARLADECEVRLSYAIGVPEPTSVTVVCRDPAEIPESELEALVRAGFPLTPGGIIESLGLQAPIYQPTACHGHFGRDPDEGLDGTFSWERTDRVGALRTAAGLTPDP